MIEGKEAIKEREALLSNASFGRYASGLELYQQMFVGASSEDEKHRLRHRMRTLHVEGKKKYAAEVLGDEKNMAKIAIELSEDILRQCEEGIFTRSKFAEALLSSTYGRTLVDKWRPKQAGYIEPGAEDMIYLNDWIRYHFDDKEKTQISIHIEPVNASPQDMMLKMREGLRLLAAQLQVGKINAKQIMMTSWLLTQKIAERFFGDDLPLEMVQSHEDTKPALDYNAKRLGEYLRTGELPLIGRVTLSKEEFIRRVLAQSP